MMRVGAAAAAICLVAITSHAAAQPMPGMDMPSVTTPNPLETNADTAAAKGKRPVQANSPAAKQKGAAPAGAGTEDMKGVEHHAMSEMEDTAMAGMSMESPQQVGTALEAGNAPAPAAPTDHAADRAYPPRQMAMAREHLQEHHGGDNFAQVMLNIAEIQFQNGGEGYRWDGQAWFGGDINRLVAKSEGEGTFRDGIGTAEVQVLYSRAIGPYFNLQAGAREDLGPSPKRTYATVGFEGLAPEFFEVGGAAFVSNKGDVLGRLEGYYNQRITQRLILQPRVELNFAAQDVPENKIGSGLSNAELGLRLRYEIRREFAPYVGLSWNRNFGDTAEFVRSGGGSVTSFSVVAGIRAWF